MKNTIFRLRKDLFSTPIDSFITFSLFIIITFTVNSSLKWFIFQADWTVVTKNIHLYLFGSYPSSSYWRPILWLLSIVSVISITLTPKKFALLNNKIYIAWLMILPLGLYLIGGGLGLDVIPSRNWGGLSLTLILTIASLYLALPLGLLLAIGRQSNLYLIESICRIYIDLMRSFPLISVLFFCQLLIPLFLPMNIEISRFYRAVIGFSAFCGAYIAEDIRGGLQSISKNQKEAALALGLSSWQTLQLIILPQAIRTSLPALTNQVIGLVQNTSLMAILGLVELLGISRSLLANPDFIGRYLEVYVWLALVYWITCTIMSIIARHLENRLNPLNTNNNK